MKLLNSVKGYFARILARHLSERTRRIFAISSVAMKISGKKFDKGTAAKVNQLFHLTHDPAALHTAMHWGPVIWQGDKGKIDLQDSQFGSEGNQVDAIVEKIPEWLAYSKEEMRKDVQTLIENKSVLS